MSVSVNARVRVGQNSDTRGAGISTGDASFFAPAVGGWGGPGVFGTLGQVPSRELAGSLPAGAGREMRGQDFLTSGIFQLPSMIEGALSSGQ